MRGAARRLACAWLAAGLAPSARADTAFWRPYRRDGQTWALFHFDARVEEGPASRRGAVSSGLGRFGRALVFTGPGGVLRAESPAAPPPGSFAVEAWIRPARLPEAEAVILALEPPQAGRHVSLSVGSDGALVFSWTGEAGPATLRSQPNAILPGRWAHVAGAVAALPWNGRAAVFVDGVQLAGVPVQKAGWPRAALPGAALVVGNDPAGGRPFLGSIDEVRVQGGAFAYFPEPDESWIERAREVPRAGAPYLPERHVSFQASFDGSLQAERGAAREPLAAEGARFVPGVRGQALLGQTTFAAANLDPTQGALELWFRSDGWDNLHDFNVPIASGPGVLYVFNRGAPDVSPAPLSFHVPEPRDERDFVRADGLSLAPLTWHHVVVGWRGRALELFVDGRRRGRSEARAGLIAAPLVLGSPQTVVDEVFVYDRPLTEQEAANAFARYRDPGMLRVPSPLDLGLSDFPGLGRLVLRAGLTAIDAAGKISDVAFTVLSEGRRLWERVARPASGGEVETIAELAEPATGTLCVRAEARDAAGNVLAAAERSVVREKPAWLANAVGREAVVLPPWTPLVVSSDVVETWGRRTRLGRDGLPMQIDSQGAPLLDGPMRFEVEPGREAPAVPGSGLRWTRRDPSAAEYVAESALDGLAVRVEGRQEYDGQLELTVWLTPGSNGRIPRLALLMPLRGSEAQDYYALGSRPFQFRAGELQAGEGPLWNSRDGGFFERGEDWSDPARLSRDSAMTIGSFVPFVWVGNGERGLGWMADNDRGWIPSADLPAVELERREGRTLLRLNLLARETRSTQARVIRFVLMATPARPLPSGWRRWMHRAGPFGTSGLAVFEDHLRSGRAHADGTVQHEPFPVDAAKSRAYAARLHERGERYLPYQEFVSFTARGVEYAPFVLEWAGSFPVESLNDLRVARLREWSRQAGVDGTYVDNVFPRPSFEPGLGSAYRLDDGRIQPGFHLSGLRSYLKRLRTMLHLEGRTPPLITVHATHTLPIPSLDFADIVLNGEDHYVGGPGTEDFMRRWQPLAVLRVVSDGRRWGVAPSFLAPTGAWDGRDAPEAYAREWRSALATLLLHDVHLLPAEHDPLAPQWPRRALSDWGIDRPDVVFHPYWIRTDRVVALGDELKAAYWARGEAKLVIVTNFGRQPADGVLELQAREPTALVDADTGDPIAGEGGRFRVQVPARSFRLLKTMP